jgi:Uma2 family endonuclease
MSVLTAPEPSFAPLPLYRISVEKYHEMIRKGIIEEGAPIELVEGMLVQKMTKYQPHRYATQTLRDLLSALLPPGWFVDDQEPVTTSDSEPEPDVAVIRGTRRQYLEANHHPGPADTGLVIEVAESSLAFDRGTKRRVYARAGISTYGIVNLVDRKVEVYTEPTGPTAEPAYRQQRDFSPGDEVPVTLDGHDAGRVRVADLLL